MIKYTDKELNEMYAEALEKKVRSEIESRCQNFPETEDMDDDEFNAFVDEYYDKNKLTAEKDFLRRVQTGTYDCHETLEAVSKTMNLVFKLLDTESSLLLNPEWFKSVHKAGVLLHNIYNAIGDEHLEAIPDNMLELIEEQKRKNKEKGLMERKFENKTEIANQQEFRDALSEVGYFVDEAIHDDYSNRLCRMIDAYTHKLMGGEIVCMDLASIDSEDK